MFIKNMLPRLDLSPEQEAALAEATAKHVAEMQDVHEAYFNHLVKIDNEDVNSLPSARYIHMDRSGNYYMQSVDLHHFLGLPEKYKDAERGRLLGYNEFMSAKDVKENTRVQVSEALAIMASLLHGLLQ
jgi:hypothetical protein